MEQQWVTVQQKTFTKWFHRRLIVMPLLILTDNLRLNSKVSCRNVAVNDLVKDLSDGVT